jgi:hypothetical protein
VAWKLPSVPVKPCTMILDCLFTSTDIVSFYYLWRKNRLNELFLPLFFNKNLMFFSK